MPCFHETLPFHFLHFVLQFPYDGNYAFGNGTY